MNLFIVKTTNGWYLTNEKLSRFYTYSSFRYRVRYFHGLHSQRAVFSHF